MDPNPSQNRIAEIGGANFESEVLNSKQPVLVEFSAAWSHPCHVIESVLNEVAAGCAGSVRVLRVDADDNPDLSLWYDVQSIPTLLFFVDGDLRAKVVGTATKEAILAKLRAISRGDDAGSPNVCHQPFHEQTKDNPPGKGDRARHPTAGGDQDPARQRRGRSQ